MKKYRVDYMDRDEEIATVYIEALGAVVDGPLVILFDKHGEDDCIFLRDDVVNIKEMT